MTLEIFRTVHRELWEKLQGIPGPEPSFPLGNALDFAGKQAWEVCSNYAQHYGGITKIWIGGSPALVLNDPHAIYEVLGSADDRFYKDAPHDALAPIITAENMFIANGTPWEFARTHSPFSHRLFSEWLDGIFLPLQSFVRNRVENTQGQIGDLTEYVRRLAYDAFSVAIWGEELGDQSYLQFMELAKIGSHRMLELPVLQKIPPLSPSFYLHRSNWYGDFEQRVSRAFEDANSDSNHLLAKTIRAGTSLNTQKLANQFSAPVYFGGVFSMASSIVYCLWSLSHAPKELQGLEEQLADTGSYGCVSQSKSLMELGALDRALRETLRLHPPVPLYFRNTHRDRTVSVSGHELPPNTLLLISNWYLQRCQEHWNSPLEYLPARWTQGLVDGDPLGSGYFFPFGRGPRTCIGQVFGMFFMKIALAELIRSKRLRIDTAQKLSRDYFFAVQHPKNLQAVFENPSR